jgi:XTP/dITP diphosphohydrolase
MKIVFATNNKHKVEEVKGLLPKEIEVLTLNEIKCSEDIEEIADTLEGNAKIKSDHVKIHYGFDCFADDTGLEVEALDGAPGVYSARYAGEEATFDDNVQKLLAAMKGVQNRKARFRTMISLNLDGKQLFFEGVCEGYIEKITAGNKGFGYDPIFRPVDFDKTFAEMDLSEKGRISHRGLAVKKLVAYLKSQI